MMSKNIFRVTPVEGTCWWVVKQHDTVIYTNNCKERTHAWAVNWARNHEPSQVTIQVAPLQQAEERTVSSL
jgi:hypothetical protein